MPFVRYRFKSCVKGNFVAQDKEITVFDLKYLIACKEKLTCDMDVFKFVTNERYEDDKAFIPANSTVIIVRKPFANPAHTKKIFARHDLNSATKYYLATRPPKAKKVNTTE